MSLMPPIPPQTVDGLNIAILGRIRESSGEFVPWNELEKLSSQPLVDLRSLAAFGFGIEQDDRLGVAYRGHASRLCPDQIEYELQTHRIGRRIAVWSRASSTNDLAARAAASIANDGLVVLAEEQTAGRGQRGRVWTAPRCSSILMSIVIFPPDQPNSESAPRGEAAIDGRGWLTALASVAVAEVVTAWSGREARIKWPNDVRVNGRKIAGILVEWAGGTSRTADRAGARAGAGAVIGIGLNANLTTEDFPPELRERSTSLRILRGGKSVDRSELARDLIRRLDLLYESGRTGDPEGLSRTWSDLCEHLGDGVRIKTPGGPVVGRLLNLDIRHGLTLAEAGGLDSRESRRITIPLAEILALEGHVELTGL